MRVLVTGSAGQVAQVFIRAHTAPDATSGLEFRALDVVPTEGVADSIIGDISDEAAVVKAAEGCDAIVHLTHGGGNSAPWEQALKVDYIGTYNVFEAAVRCGCSRVVYASRAGVMSGFGPEAPYAMDETRTVHMTPKPVGYYSVSKVFGESLGYMYATRETRATTTALARCSSREVGRCYRADQTARPARLPMLCTLVSAVDRSPLALASIAAALQSTRLSVSSA
jgi:nucleoside-diphosphate-sugar epimerase